VVTTLTSVSYNLIRLNNLWQNTRSWLYVCNSMFSMEVHTCGGIQHETLRVHCILFYLLFKMYMYAEILFCYVLTRGIRLLVQVSKIRIFTHMYISISTCMQLEFVLHSLPSLLKEEVSVNSLPSIQFSFIPAQFRMLHWPHLQLASPFTQITLITNFLYYLIITLLACLIHFCPQFAVFF